MSVSITCPCGKKYRVKDTLAGKKIRCTDCAEVLKVPLQDAGNVAELDEFDTLPTPSRDQEERQSSLPPRTKRRSKVMRRDVEPDEPASRKLIEKRWFGSTSGGVLGGVLMIVIAIVWFVVGLAGGRIFFYPPVL